MELKELILRRKSIRKYDMTPLESPLLAEIERTVRETKPLIQESGKFDCKIRSHAEFIEKTRGAFRIDAPHYLFLYGDGSDDAFKNIGYAGELAVLELTKRGLGTCWLGGAKSGETLENSDYSICIAFGKPLEQFRDSADGIKRKALDEISEGYDNGQRGLLELARLAPSAVNLQPWYFKCLQSEESGGRIDVFRKTGGGLYGFSKHLRNLQKIDIGIAIAHFTVKPFVYKKLDVNDKGMIYEGTLLFDSQ